MPQRPEYKMVYTLAEVNRICAEPPATPETGVWTLYSDQGRHDARSILQRWVYRP